MVEVGKKAPAFRLKNQDGDTVTLSDLKGRRVLLFAYPKAATPGCTKQACGLRDGFDTFRSADAVVLGLSPDAPDVLKKWKEAEGFPFDLLSDPDHAVLEAYGAWGEKSMYGNRFMGVIRSHFVIDETGKLADVQIKVSPARSVERAISHFERAATAG